MKDLDSIKLKSDENDDSKKEKSIYNFSKLIFDRNKESKFQNFLEIGKNLLFNTNTLPLAIENAVLPLPQGRQDTVSSPYCTPEATLVGSEFLSASVSI